MVGTDSRVHQDDPSFVRPVHFRPITHLISQTNSEVPYLSLELLLSIRLVCPRHKDRIGFSYDVHIGVCHSSWIIVTTMFIVHWDGSVNLDGSLFDASFPDAL